MSRPYTHLQRSLLSKVRSNCRIPEFWVITCYFNPCKYENRYNNYHAFRKNMQKQNVNLLTIELCDAGQQHLNETMSDMYVQIIEKDVLWAKERLLNIALAHLPEECTQVCWCDCDILFETASWALQCSDLLKNHKIVQPFSKAIFLGPTETPQKHSRYRVSTSFASNYIQTYKRQSLVGSTNVLQGHPGYAWAAQRTVLGQIGGLYDKCILGHGDIVMALAFCHNPAVDGEIPEFQWEPHWHTGWSDALCLDIRQWQRQASAVIKGDVAVMPGKVHHLFHGCPRNRQYVSRGNMISDFDPAIHLTLSSQSPMWIWSDEAIQLGIDKRVLQYFKNRKEDDNTQLV